MTISYGHGISVSPLASCGQRVRGNGEWRHIGHADAAARGGATEPGPRVISPETSATLRAILRQVVVRGTASYGDVDGLCRRRQDRLGRQAECHRRL